MIQGNDSGLLIVHPQGPTETMEVMSSSYHHMDCSPPGFSVHGILQARVLERLLCPPPGDLPNTGNEHRSPALQAGSLPSEPTTDLQSILAADSEGFSYLRLRHANLI